MKIDKKITGYAVKKDQPVVPTPKAELNELLQRPEILHGATYKLKPSEHAMYITVNDVEIEGRKYPYEIMINTKCPDSHQWVAALTRVISAVFRKGGDVRFLAEELKAVFDPKGGYWKKGKYIPSVVAEIGSVLEQHLSKSINS